MEKINQLFGAGMKKIAIPVAGAASFIAIPAHAADDTNMLAVIQAAIASGQTSYQAVTAGVVTVAALGFCVGMIVMWLKK